MIHRTHSPEAEAALARQIRREWLTTIDASRMLWLLALTPSGWGDARHRDLTLRGALFVVALCAEEMRDLAPVLSPLVYPRGYAEALRFGQGEAVPLADLHHYAANVGSSRPDPAQSAAQEALRSLLAYAAFGADTQAEGGYHCSNQTYQLANAVDDAARACELRAGRDEARRRLAQCAGELRASWPLPPRPLPAEGAAADGETAPAFRLFGEKGWDEP